MCDFAPSTGSEVGFLRPVTQPIALHFVAGHIHPLIQSVLDGNGTTVRAPIRPIEKLRGYLSRRSLEIRSVDGILGTSLLPKELTHRQAASMSDAPRNPGEIYPIKKLAVRWLPDCKK